jgi:flagellar hook-length control protein FliK
MKFGEKEHFMTENEQVDFFSEETKNPVKQAAANNTVSGTQMRAEDVIKETITMPKDSKMKQTDRVLLLQEKNSSDQSLASFPGIPATEDAGAEGNLTKQSSELQTKDQPEVVAKVSDSDGSKAQFNQGPFISKLNTSNGFGHKPLKITASHIEDIQKAIELQIEKTTDLGSTVVKIRLTPDNIGDIHVQLIKTEDSITAILHVQNAETKGLLEEQLPMLMEPFKQNVSEGPLTLTVVADSNLAFSFSEGADSDNRKSERQEARKRTTKEKTETKDQPKMNQSISGLSLLA